MVRFSHVRASTVLSDLSEAVTLKAIKSETVQYSSGNGYAYSPTEKGHKSAGAKAAEVVDKYHDDIDWVLEEFGTESAARLELISTIIFAEREMRRKKQQPAHAELQRRVKRIKPHFTDETISETIERLSGDDLIVVVDA